MFAELKDPVRRKVERYGLDDEIQPRHFFPTVEAAVEAFRAETGAEWVDGGPPPAVPSSGPPPRKSVEDRLPDVPR